MNLPGYYNNLPIIKLKDDLALFFGAPTDGVLEISYPDIVKMAGHSCATVAGAYLMTLKGLKTLYNNELPNRGNIKVELRDHIEDGSTAVSASVFTNITGAATEFGFAGLAGNYSRRNLLSYGAHIEGYVRFTRLDTEESVVVNYNPAKVVHPGNILMSAIGPKANDETRESFAYRWQEMIKTLFEKMDEIVEVC